LNISGSGSGSGAGAGRGAGGGAGTGGSGSGCGAGVGAGTGSTTGGSTGAGRSPQPDKVSARSIVEKRNRNATESFRCIEPWGSDAIVSV